MTRIVSGTVHGNTIELDQDLGIADGQAVEVQVKLVPLKGEWGEGILRTAGALANDPEWDAAMEEIYEARKKDRRPISDSTECV
jgi:hypothetical protein